MKSMFYVSICLLLAMAMLLGGCGSPAVSEITAKNTDRKSTRLNSSHVT